ncbi:hypothetical protein ASPACDRAFT_38234 [Aspergillus aculeatus ATCC 16872]|uniref:Protein kinase domain-containing protein n=1 Tax=Aspergillus aculeatus (strain ATCC 16872 / CBS 172.66 / WB 5094) TaxID=690307 RepID=A0A1L9X8B3_ASPA1|nr:uncharacterized protein ASPACDRAFT_38234 [Aspergillus aculeatus ATCC 16872]OJK04672.1 hypothetical protein ASPACDRAFT_38234 [Aspergillus aculeatus ATCC 16872]
MSGSTSRDSSQYFFAGSIPTYNKVTRKSTNHLGIYSGLPVDIYTVVYDPDEPRDVLPLVYAKDLSLNVTRWNGSRMGLSGGSFLLTDGDILDFSHETQLVFNHPGHSAQDTGPDVEQMAAMSLMSCELKFTSRKLGPGGYGTIYMVYRRDNGRQLACKVQGIRPMRKGITMTIKEEFESKQCLALEDCDSAVQQTFQDEVKKRLDQKLEVMRQEALILKDLCHPSIISLQKFAYSNNNL